MIEANSKKVEIKIADEMAETGYLAYRIKKKNNIKQKRQIKSCNG
jgi:hypothetical protein